MPINAINGVSLLAQIVKKSSCNARDPDSIPREDTLEKKMATHSRILA